MSIVGGVDIHRKQLTFDYVEQETGRWERGRVAPADREHLAEWLVRFDGVEDVQFAMEGCTGWRYVAEEMRAAEQGLTPGVRLTVIDRQPFNGPTIVRLSDGTTRVVGQELALLLLCRPSDGE